MGSDRSPERLVARAARVDAFAAGVKDALDEYVREQARRHRDDYQRAGVRTEMGGSPGRDDLDYVVEIICIEPGAADEGTRRITMDVTRAITETARFDRLAAMRRQALRDAAEFRRRAARRVYDAGTGTRENVERIWSVFGGRRHGDVVLDVVGCSADYLSQLEGNAARGTAPNGESAETPTGDRSGSDDRERGLERGGNACRRCGDSGADAELVVGLPTVGGGEDETLVTLCENCHEDAHAPRDAPNGGQGEGTVRAETTDEVVRGTDAGESGHSAPKQTTIAEFLD